MRMAILTAIAAMGLGFVGSSAVSAAPVYGTSMGAAAARLDLRQDTYVVRHSYYHPYYRRHGRYGRCFQTCPDHEG